MRYAELLDRCGSLLPQLTGEERTQGERVVAICRLLDERERADGVLTAATEDAEFKREFGRLVELLSRRSAKAIPLAKLGRAALADLAGDRRSANAIGIECDAQLSLMGL
jgi:hypothetical protein